jgi:hypothetical protein
MFNYHLYYKKSKLTISLSKFSAFFTFLLETEIGSNDGDPWLVAIERVLSKKSEFAEIRGNSSILQITPHISTILVPFMQGPFNHSSLPTEDLYLLICLWIRANHIL